MTDPDRLRRRPMVWQEYDRPGATARSAWSAPDELRGGHRFELIPADGGTLLRHTIEGTVTGRFQTIWSERIEPLHNQILEAILDNQAAA